MVAFTVLAYWTVGFFPFHWSLPFIAYENAAQRNLEGGWQFPRPGIVKTMSAPDWLSEAIERSSLHIVLEIRPAAYDQSGPARIVSISKDPYHQNMVIAQDGTSLVLRLRTPQTNLSGIPSYQIEGVFAHLEWQRLDLLIDPKAVQLKINGAKRLAAMLPVRPLSVWNTDYSLALGNEMTFDRPWLGEIRRAEITVEDKTIDYALDNLLDLPQRYYVSRSSCWAQIVPFSCGELDQQRLLDWLLNLIGFVPFGLIVTGLLPRKGMIRTAALASFGLSMSIEFGQVFLPQRYPSTEDLLLNVVGGVIGATVVAKILIARYETVLTSNSQRRAPSGIRED